MINKTGAALAMSSLGFILTVIWGDPFLRVLRRLRIGKIIRAEGPAVQFTKMGTPTMGGLMFIFPTLLLNLLMSATQLFGVSPVAQSFFIPMLALICYALIGAIDDWEGIRGARRGLGMSAKMKSALQFVVSIVFAWLIREKLGISQFVWPGAPEPIDVGFWFYPIAVFFIVGMSNAVNLTDGMDGLAGLICATAFAGYGCICLMEGETYIGQFCFILVGALFGFLWFNVNPALLFMGDTGSLALGAALAVVALISKHWLVLPIIAIIPVCETVSVILQVGYFKLTHGKRLFKMAPIHHHFQEIGWSEVQVVQRFWLISLLFVMLGVSISMA